jgi:hypothetical protein
MIELPVIRRGEAPAPTRWVDLLLYVGVGFGAFLAATAVIGYFTEAQGTLALALAGLANFLCLGGTAYVLGIRRGRLTWADLGLYPPRWKWGWLALIATLTVALIPLRALASLVALWVVEGGFDSLQRRADLLAPGFSWVGFGVALIVAGILIPISEELFFRGALYGWLRRRYRVWVAVLASATVFGLAHFDSLGVIISSFIMGLVIALVYEYTRSLWTAIAIHIFNNSLAVVLLYAVLALLERFPQLQTISP